MPGNSERRGRRATPKKGAVGGSGGKGRGALAGRGRTLPAEERPWHKAYSGTEDVPQRTAWKQDKERRAAAAEGRAPKAGQPGTVDTTWGKGTKGRKAVPKSGSTGRGSSAGRGAAGGRTSAGGR
ncbi:MAG TPA: 23S rRNA (guanosine(2251)-2'-O)-methyltransferase RlmB, partial [Micromonosporaceae bacterium]